MKNLYLVVTLVFLAITQVTGQKVPASELKLKQNEWHNLNTFDDFGDVNGSYDVLIKMIDCKNSNDDNHKVTVRIFRTKENDHTITFWADLKENKPFDFPIALFPTIQVKMENGSIQDHEIPMMSEGVIAVYSNNPLGKLLNNGTGEQLKILINFSDNKSLLQKCLIPVVTH